MWSLIKDIANLPNSYLHLLTFSSEESKTKKLQGDSFILRYSDEGFKTGLKTIFLGLGQDGLGQDGLGLDHLVWSSDQKS